MGKLMNIESLTRTIEKAFQDANVVELMVHPGYPSIEAIGGCDASLGPDEFSMSRDRLHELHQLSNSDFSSFLLTNQIKLTSFEHAFNEYQ
jgi:hypothetical protein